MLDACDVDRAHVVGMSLGGTLAQLLLLDHPDRLRSVSIRGMGHALGKPVVAPLAEAVLPFTSSVDGARADGRLGTAAGPPDRPV